MTTRKDAQLTSAIENAVREVLARGLNDPRVRGLITVTGVKVLTDHTKAIISISVYPEDRQNLTLHGIQSAATYIRREVGDRVQTRQLPEFEFRLDTRLKAQASVLTAIEQARADLEARGVALAPQELPPGTEDPDNPHANPRAKDNETTDDPDDKEHGA
jgi:ribosome-binding factor A